MSERHVLIIGAGIIGLCTAYYALRKGFRVTVVERDGRTRKTTSFGNAGMLVPSHIVPLAAPGAVPQAIRGMMNRESPVYVHPTLDPKLWRWGYHFWRSATPAHVQRSAPLLRDLNEASLACYEELASELGSDIGFHRRGLLILCCTPSGLEEEERVARRANALGMNAKVLDPSSVSKLQPGVETSVVGGVYFPGDAQIDPGRTMLVLQGWLEHQGVDFLWHREVCGWKSNGRITTVRTVHVAPLEVPGPKPPVREPPFPDNGKASHDGLSLTHDLVVDEIVLAAGVWSEGLAEQLGLRLPMRAGKGYSLTLPNAPELLTVPTILAEARVAMTPLGRALRVGGTMEVLDVQARERAQVSSRRVRGILRSISAYFPNYTPSLFEGLPVWFGFRPTSPDGLPYLGRSTRYPNLIVATGHAMQGVSMGPITGTLVAELLAGDAPSLPLEALRIDRFGRKSLKRFPDLA